MANTCSRRCWPNPCSNTSDRLSNTQFEEVFVVIRPDFAKFLRLRRNTLSVDLEEPGLGHLA